MKLKEIERLRGVAILMVLVVHWGALRKFLPPVAGDSWSGVDLFFVISGYVVSLSLLRLMPPLDARAAFLEAYDQAKPALKTFYARRFFRIMPAALTVMLVNRLLVGIFPNEFGSVASWWTEFFAFFGGIYNYVIPFYTSFKLGQYWSLAVEEHFYLILPLLFVLFRTTNRRIAAALGVGLFSVVCRALPQPETKVDHLEWYMRFASHLRFDSLMAGVALALVADRVRTAPVMPPRLMRFFVLPFAVAIVWCLPGAAPEYVMSHAGLIALWTVSGLLVFFAGQDKGYVLSFPVLGRVLEYVGSRSYSLYLVHVSIGRLEAVERTPWPQYAKLVPSDGEWPWKQVLVLLTGSMIAAELLYRLVEQPFIRMGRRVLDRKPALSKRAWRIGIAGAAVWAAVYLEHPLLVALGPRDLARGMAVYQSSQGDGTPPSALVNGRLEWGHSPRTKDEDSPWMMIDLGRPTQIGAIRIYNRDDGSQGDTIPLLIQASEDNQHWETVARRDLLFTSEWPWRIRCHATKARYLRFTAEKKTTLALSEVEVFESAQMAALP